MSDIDYENVIFNCSRMGKEVTITRKIRLHYSSATGELDMRTVIGRDCDHKAECGVGIKSGRSISYNWKECVNPELKDI